MKTNEVIVFSLCFLFLCVAEIADQQQAENATEIEATNIQRVCGQDDTTVRELEAKLNILERQLEDLRSMVQASQGNRVAFGASINEGGYFGPYNAEITLVYSKVYVNTGSYNPATGIFTAPVKGVYYFSFSGHNLSTKPMGLRLMKNGKQMVTVYNHVAGNRHETATNGMILQLDVGEQVYMRLRQNTWIFDNTNDHSTFIGHLLFPL